MTQQHVSVPIPTEHAELMRRAAARQGLSLPAFVDKVATVAAEKETKRQDRLAEWREEQARIDAEAEAMTDEDMWGDTPPLPEEEKMELRAQLLRTLDGSPESGG